MSKTLVEIDLTHLGRNMPSTLISSAPTTIILCQLTVDALRLGLGMLGVHMRAPSVWECNLIGKFSVDYDYD